MSTWLEKEVLDVAEQYIDVFVAEGRNIAQTVLMYFDLARHSFTIERRPKVNIRQLHRAPI